jgi:hypothetical protein
MLVRMLKGIGDRGCPYLNPVNYLKIMRYVIINLYPHTSSLQTLCNPFTILWWKSSHMQSMMQ